LNLSAQKALGWTVDDFWNVQVKGAVCIRVLIDIRSLVGFNDSVLIAEVSYLDQIVLTLHAFVVPIHQVSLKEEGYVFG